MYCRRSSLFASQLSSLQGIGTTECWVTRILEILQHFLRRSTPRSTWYAIVSSVPSLFWSGPQERPMTAKKIFERIRQLLLNFFHIILHFRSHPVQWRWTLRWRWSCLWNPLNHTVIRPSFSESHWGWSLSWILGRSSTRTPWVFHQFDSVRCNWFPNTTEFVSSRTQQDRVPFSPNTAPSPKRHRPWQWRIDELQCATSLSISTLNPQSQSGFIPVVSV